MSKIFFKVNLETRNWIVTEDNLTHHYVDVPLGFISTNSVIEFNNLSFGFKLFKDNLLIEEVEFPKNGITYLATDQEILETARFTLEHNTGYLITVWVNDSGLRSEQSYSFTTPEFIPEPYPDYEVE